MATKVAKAGVKREKGWLYFLDKNGNVARAKMVKGGGKHGKQRQEVIARTGVKRQEGYLYFIDKQGDVAMTKMNRGGKRKRR